MVELNMNFLCAYKFFKQVVSVVEEEIGQSIGRVGTVVLVGGFGQNPYLRNRLRGAVGQNVRLFYTPDGYVDRLFTALFIE
jgi:tRNA A37 threonylcarbamoyltransferase TsaD